MVFARVPGSLYNRNALLARIKPPQSEADDRRSRRVEVRDERRNAPDRYLLGSLQGAVSALDRITTSDKCRYIIHKKKEKIFHRSDG